MTECIAWMGHWDTTKTTTFEMAIGTRHGMMSIRVVESANGKKTEVFTGFDAIWDESVGQPCTWHTDTGLPVPAEVAFWEHRYIASIEKAAKKWGGQHQQIDPCKINDVWAWAPGRFEEAIYDHIRDDEKAGGHFDMLLGKIPGVSSSTRPPPHPAIAEGAKKLKAERAAALQSDFATRAAADELYGIF